MALAEAFLQSVPPLQVVMLMRGKFLGFQKFQPYNLRYYYCNKLRESGKFKITVFVSRFYTSVCECFKFVTHCSLGKIEKFKSHIYSFYNRHLSKNNFGKDFRNICLKLTAYTFKMFNRKTFITKLPKLRMLLLTLPQMDRILFFF